MLRKDLRKPETLYFNRSHPQHTAAAGPSIPPVPSAGAARSEKVARETADMAVAQAQAKASAQMRVKYEKDVLAYQQGHAQPQPYPSNRPQEPSVGQLSPEQLFVDMRNLMVRQQKAASRRADTPINPGNSAGPLQFATPQGAGKKDNALQTPPNSRGAPASVDVDAATYQLAGTRIDEGETATIHPVQGNAAAFDAASMLAASSREMDVGSSIMPMPNQGTELGIALHLSAEEPDMKSRKQRADDIDKVLNGAGISPQMQNQYAISQTNNQQIFDQFRVGNGRICGSVSRSFSFLMKTGGPFASRENSMEFRRNAFNAGKRDMSIEMMRRDPSLDLMASKRMGSLELLPESELPRDMSIDFFGNSLRGAGRDFSMEMQMSQVPQGARLELGALPDDVVFGFANPSPSPQVLYGEAGKEVAMPVTDSRVYRSKFGKSSDDLTGHMLGNNQQQPYYRRAINGSIEDFREIRLPF